MRILPADTHGLREALRVLRAGGIVAHTTETCYGLACDLTAQGSVERLFALKERPRTQPVSALFASTEQAATYVVWNPSAEELAAKFLPGPLTIILALKGAAPAPLFATPDGGSTIGVRISSHPVAQALAAQMGRPLSTTSANIHGQPNTYSAAAIASQFEGHDLQPSLILDSGTLPGAPPSTVVDLSGGLHPQTLRGGDITVS